VASSISGSSGQTAHEANNQSTVSGSGSITITSGSFSGQQSWGRVDIGGALYDVPGPTSMSQGQSWPWSASHLFDHNANGERVAVAVSVSFRIDGSGNAFHANSTGAGTQGALDYDRRPAAPGFSTITRTTNSIYVELSAVASPAGDPTYYIQRNTNGGGWGDQRTDYRATFSNLPQGSTHQFRAFAANSDGQGGNTDSGVYSVPSVPGAPSISVSAPAARNRTVSAGVSASNGATVTRYFVAVSSNDGATWASSVTMNGSRQYTYSGLTPGGVYRFRVGSENEMGASSLTTSASYTIPEVPTAPTISVTAPSGRALNVSCGVSADNGSTVTGYFVQLSPDGGATWETAISMPSRVNRFEDLAGGTTVKFRVYSQNEVGFSAFTVTDSIFIPSGGRRLTAEGFISTQTFTRLTASGPVPVGIAKRLTASGWVELS
jgi:hypothetical protein